MTQTIPPPPDDDPTSVLDPAPPPGPPPGGEPEAARRLGWGLALGALVLIAVAAAAAAAYFATRGSSSSSAETTAAAATTAPTTTAALVPAGRAIVPDVTGLKEDKAAARLGAAHLNPQVKTKATPKPTGIVVSQTPPAGKQAKQGSSVTIVVDAGAPAVAVPDLTGLRVAAAGKRLADAKLKAQTTQVTAAKPAGTVVSQAPPAGTKLTQGSVVTLSVARGSATAGTTTTGATTAAAPTTTTPKTTTSAPPAHPSTATVPDVTNGTLAAAADALAQAGLFPNVAYVPGTEPLGTVLEQAKQAGTTTQWGGYVRVNVSKGSEPPANATVPDLSGRTRADGMQALSSAGFEVKVLWKQVASSVKNDIVLDEQPSRGTQAPRGALVILIVSRQPGR